MFLKIFYPIKFNIWPPSVAELLLVVSINKHHPIHPSLPKLTSPVFSLALSILSLGPVLSVSISLHLQNLPCLQSLEITDQGTPRTATSQYRISYSDHLVWYVVYMLYGRKTGPCPDSISHWPWTLGKSLPFPELVLSTPVNCCKNQMK